MTILKYQVFGGNSVGVYLAVNNSYGLYPPTLIAPTIEKIKSAFSEPFFPISINNSSLIGVYTASNKNGIIVPHIIREEELQNLKTYTTNINSDYQIGVLKSKDNAFGNLILCNDQGAIISSFLKEYKNVIEDILKVETIVYEYVDMNLPGSILPYLSSGAVVNDQSGIFGHRCTGPEMMRLTNVLML